MIYLFTGNTPYLLHQEKQKWKHVFWKKYGVEQVIHIADISWVSPSFLQESLLQRGIFSEKRLVIIEGFPYSRETKFWWATELENTILQHIHEIDDETFVLFVSENPDKRKSGYTTLKKIAKIQDFSLKNDTDVIGTLQNMYASQIGTNALKKLVFLKWGNLEKCICEIQKLLISKPCVSIKDVETHITPEFEQSIFLFIDEVLCKNKKYIFSGLNNLLENTNMYALYQSIMANLRIFLYIEYLKKMWHQRNINDILKLWNRAFLINKHHKSSLSEIQALYTDLLNFDKNMKTGKFISSDEKDLEQELERVFVKFLA